MKPAGLSENDKRALVLTLVVDSKATGIGGGTTTKGRIPPPLCEGFIGLLGFLDLVCYRGGLVVVGDNCN